MSVEETAVRHKRKIQGDTTMLAIREMTFEQKMELLLRIKMERDPDAALQMLADARDCAIQWRRQTERNRACPRPRHEPR